MSVEDLLVFDGGVGIGSFVCERDDGCMQQVVCGMVILVIVIWDFQSVR